MYLMLFESLYRLNVLLLYFLLFTTQSDEEFFVYACDGFG